MMKRLEVLVILALLPLTTFAASFDCTKASTAGEKAICADPELSKLDEQLAKAYKRALQKGPRAKVQVDQRAWLKEQRDCGADRFCLEGKYNIRIAQLEGVHWSLADWQRASGTWSEAESNEVTFQKLEIKSVTASGFDFILETSNPIHGGSIEDQARFTPDGALFISTDDWLDCRLRFLPLDQERLRVVSYLGDIKGDKGPCESRSNGAEFGGLFLKGVHEKQLGLVDLEVFKTPAEDQAFRTLVGDAYRIFVERNAGPECGDSGGKDIDGLGTEVNVGCPHGDMAIIMQAPDGRIYAAYADGTELHYFSNDPRYKNKIPRTIEAWKNGEGPKD